MDLAKIDPELEQVLSQMPPAPGIGDFSDVPACREYMRGRMQQLVTSGIILPIDMTGVSKEEIKIPVRDGATVRALLYKPEKSSGGPLALFFHGGGWCIGMPEMHERDCVGLVKSHGAVAISVDYRKAPEHVFPTAPNDAWDSVKWAAANASKLGADPSKGFIVGGASAGGNLSAIVALLARDEKLSPPLTGVYLSVPLVVDPSTVPEKFKPDYNAREQNKGAPLLDAAAIAFFQKWYKPDPANPLFCPLLWPTGHKNLPPTYFSIAGMDPLRDDGLIYEKLLRENCGVKTKMDVYPGQPHAFQAFIPQLTASKKAFEDLSAGLNWLLSQK